MRAARDAGCGECDNDDDAGSGIVEGGGCHCGVVCAAGCGGGVCVCVRRAVVESTQVSVLFSPQRLSHPHVHTNIQSCPCLFPCTCLISFYTLYMPHVRVCVCVCVCAHRLHRSLSEAPTDDNLCILIPGGTKNNTAGATKSAAGSTKEDTSSDNVCASLSLSLCAPAYGNASTTSCAHPAWLHT